MMLQKTYLVMGASAAGLGAVYRLRMLDRRARIVCISYENGDPYNKCFLADYFGMTKKRSEITTLTTERAAEKNITYIAGLRVTNIEASEQYVVCSDGTIITYDALCIATGSIPRISAINECKIRGIFTFHYSSDIDSIHIYMRTHTVRSAVVVGAGLTGLEIADRLNVLGITTISVIELADNLLRNHVDESGATLIRNYMHNRGIAFYAEKSVIFIEQQQDVIHAVTLSDYSTIKTDLLVYAMGSKPNTEIAHTANIALRNEYIKIDSHMRTNVPTIYAAGDCAVLPEQTAPPCIWSEAMRQGSIAAYNMIGQAKQHTEEYTITNASFFGIQLATCGQIALHADLLPFYTITAVSGVDFHHRFIYQNDFLRGFVLVGNTQSSSDLRRKIVPSSFIYERKKD